MVIHSVREGTSPKVMAAGALTAMALVLTACASPESAETPSTSAPESTSATESPSPTEEPMSEEPAPDPAPSGSEIVSPVCGEPFALPESAPQLRFDVAGSVAEEQLEGSPSSLKAMVSLTNDGDDTVAGGLDYSVFLVVVDGEGLTVASGANPENPAPESSNHLALAAGDTTDLPAAASWNDACPGASTDPMRLLDPGEYEVFGLVNVYGDDGAVLQQAQGGPWPLTVGAEAPALAPMPEAAPPVAGGVPLDSRCNVPFDAQPATGLELEAGPIRTPRAADDSIDGFELTVTADTAVAGASALPVVFLSQDGQLVNGVPETDSGAFLTMSADTSVRVSGWTPLIDCSYEPLLPGTYTAHPVLVGGSYGSLAVIARAPDQEIVIQ